MNGIGIFAKIHFHIIKGKKRKKKKIVLLDTALIPA